MDINVFVKDTHDLYTTPLLQQTAYWSVVKSKLGFIPLAFEIVVREKDIHPQKRTSARLSDDILILYRKISQDKAICYAPYGPLLEPDEEKQGEFIESLSEELRRVLPKDTIDIRYDLPWFTDDISSEIKMNWGTNNHNIRLSASGILPSNTCFIDLAQAEEDIFLNMKKKTRYNIALSERRGVKVRAGGE